MYRKPVYSTCVQKNSLQYKCTENQFTLNVYRKPCYAKMYRKPVYTSYIHKVITCNVCPLHILFTGNVLPLSLPFTCKVRPLYIPITCNVCPLYIPIYVIFVCGIPSLTDSTPFPPLLSSYNTLSMITIIEYARLALIMHGKIGLT